VHARFHYVGPDGKPDMAKWTRETDLIDDVLRYVFAVLTRNDAAGLTYVVCIPIRRGFCDSPPFPKDDKVCGAFNYNATHNPMMYRFDLVDYNPLYNGACVTPPTSYTVRSIEPYPALTSSSFNSVGAVQAAHGASDTVGRVCTPVAGPQGRAWRRATLR